jgi:hypothetical protein
VDASALGPLFVRPDDPHYLWLAGAAVAVLCLVVAAIGLVRGRLPIAWGAIGLVAAPVFAYTIGYLFVLEESKQVEFCGSCHETMAPVVAAIARPETEDDETLSGLHWRRGAVDHRTACYQCHSGYGIWGAVGAKRAGMTHMLHTITGGYEFPLETRGPFDVGSCLGCHAEAEPFRAAEDHLDAELQEALLSGEMGCTGDCHPQAHPDDALLGAAHAAEAAR